MKWTQARENYPDKWLLFEVLDAYSENGKRIVRDIAIINVFNNGKDALERYSEKHKKDKSKEMYVYHTENEKLYIDERSWIGVRNHG